MIKRKNIFGLIAILGLLIMVLEITFRLFLAYRYPSTFLEPSKIIYHYYPMAKLIEEKYEKSSNKKVLILSSSALTPEWGNFSKEFEKKLNEKGGNEFEVYDGAGVGFSSLDNLNTYLLLQNLFFDYIIYYNGINDVRLNNCPDDIFNPHYRHISWSNETAAIFSHKAMDIYVIPFFIDYHYQLLKARFCPNCFIAKNYHEQESWQQYGNHFKSLESFKNNTAKIIDLKAAESQLFLVSFATYIPEDYSFERFAKHQLDYSFHENSREVEVWGIPENVNTFMRYANDSLRTMNDPSKNVYFRDIRPALAEPWFFADVCHFSPLGITQLAQLMTDSVLLSKNHEP